MKNIVPKKRAFVALFDILGFKDLIKNDDIEYIYNTSKRLSNLRKGVRDMGRHMAALLRRKAISTLNYSDTFLLYTEDITNMNQREINIVFLALLTSCKSLFIAANENGLPIRGAITVGDIIVTGKMVLGKSIVDAYELEQNQEWIGCTISKEAMFTISKEERKEHRIYKSIVRYKVPCKNGTVKLLYAYNWTRSDTFANGNYNILKKAKSVDWSVERKHKNTVEFIKHVTKGNCRITTG
jgi:hypothetical protein